MLILVYRTYWRVLQFVKNDTNRINLVCHKADANESSLWAGLTYLTFAHIKVSYVADFRLSGCQLCGYQPINADSLFGSLSSQRTVHQWRDSNHDATAVLPFGQWVRNRLSRSSHIGNNFTNNAPDTRKRFIRRRCKLGQRRKLGAQAKVLTFYLRPSNAIGVMVEVHSLTPSRSIASNTCFTWYDFALPLSFCILTCYEYPWNKAQPSEETLASNWRV
jgi:hypothetical protein